MQLKQLLVTEITLSVWAFNQLTPAYCVFAQARPNCLSCTAHGTSSGAHSYGMPNGQKYRQSIDGPRLLLDIDPKVGVALHF